MKKWTGYYQRNYKMNHNKKRNTAFLYEALVRELTKSVVHKNVERKAAVVGVIKVFLKKN